MKRSTSKKLTGQQEANLRKKEPTHGTPLHKPKRRTVSWGLTAEEIKARSKFCADPDVHGRQCVCLTVPFKRPRNISSRDAYYIFTEALDRQLTGSRVLARHVPASPPGLSRRMAVKELVKLLRTQDQNSLVGISVEGGADFMHVLSVEPNENGVWICVEPEGPQTFNFKDGDRVRLKADAEEGVAEEVGTVEGNNSGETGDCVLVRLDEKYRADKSDDLLREVPSDQLEFIAPDELAGEDHAALIRAVHACWQAIAPDVEKACSQEGELANACAVEACIDANRLTAYGGGKEGKRMDALVSKLIQRYGYDQVLQYLCRHCPFM